MFRSVYTVLEAADGRLCLCSSFGQTVHGLMYGACVHGLAWVRGGSTVSLDGMFQSFWSVCTIAGIGGGLLVV